jgi:hypothetical protein
MYRRSDQQRLVVTDPTGQPMANDVYYIDHMGGSAVSSTGLGRPFGCSPGQYRAEYYSNERLEGAPIFTQCEEPPLERRWRDGSPHPSLPADHFSARWIGVFPFEADTYPFYIGADDGMRFWIDGVPILDIWSGHWSTSYLLQRKMEAGDHIVKVEYHEESGWATIIAYWEK